MRHPPPPCIEYDHSYCMLKTIVVIKECVYVVTNRQTIDRQVLFPCRHCSCIYGIIYIVWLVVAYIMSVSVCVCVCVRVYMLL